MTKPRTCFSEYVVKHNFLETSDSFIDRGRDEDTFACGETTSFEDDIEATGLDVCLGAIKLRGLEHGEFCCGN